MRTRRSPRNQDILFRALFKPPSAKVAEPTDRVSVLKEQLSYPFMSSRTRAMLLRDLAREEARVHARRVALEDEP